MLPKVTLVMPSPQQFAVVAGLQAAAKLMVLLMVTTLVLVIELQPFELQATKVTVYVPGPLNVWLGFCKVEVLLLPEAGSPNVQVHEVGPKVEISVKLAMLEQEDSSAAV